MLACIYGDCYVDPSLNTQEHTTVLTILLYIFHSFAGMAHDSADR